MQSTFSAPNGLTPGWTPTVQLQPVMHPVHTVHSSQMQPVMQPSQTQLMVVHPSSHLQYQLQMNKAGWSNQQSNTAQMTMACQTLNSENKLPMDCNYVRSQQENLRLQRQYQLLQSEYQAALIQMQTLTLQHTELDKKLKMDQRKYLELNNKYMIAMQSEQTKYNVLKNIHTETSNQLHREQGKCNALSVELEESRKSLKNEQLRYKFLTAVHAEAKKTLLSARQEHHEVRSSACESESKHASDKCNADVHQLSWKKPATKPNSKECNLELVPEHCHWNLSNATENRETTGAKAFCKRRNGLVIPPGFESCTRVSTGAKQSELPNHKV